MTGTIRLTTLALVIAPLTMWLGQPAPSAQDADGSRFAARIRQLPADVLQPVTAGVRGMQLTESAKLDPRLRQLVDEARQGTDVRARSLELGASAADPRLPVLVNAPDPGAVRALEQEIRSLGGEVTAVHDASVWAALPAPAVDRLAGSPNVHYLSVQDRMELDQSLGPESGGGGLSQRATGVQGLHAAGIRGRGVKIGIIDSGFGGYARLRALNKVPEPAATRVFPAAYTFENSSVHGSACAEIIYAMAPEAEVYLAAIQPEQGNTIAAAQWLISQGVEIISYSMGTVWQSSDGSGDLARFVDSTVTDKGVLWLVSSGNAGMEHWSGPNKDSDGDGLIETGPGKDAIALEIVPSGDEVKVIVRWNDWGPNPRQPTSSQNLDAFLLMEEPDGKLTLVAKGVDAQSGGPGRPLEYLQVKGKGIAGRRFALILKNTNVSRTFDVHVFLDTSTQVTLRPRTASGSVASPASARYAVAVGAWDASSNQLAPYSSQGPTDDNRLKPEVAAPAGLPSAAYDGRFHGTSASCPHAAGFAALLKQTRPDLKGVALRIAVLRAVEPKGSPVPNMASGFGWLDGGRIPLPGSAAPPAVAGAADRRPPTSSPSVESISLPLAWGGAVGADVLDALHPPAAPAPFLTRIVTGRDLYRIGDGLKVGFVTSENCDYLLFHRSSSGHYTLLSPRGGTVATLSAGGAVVLPTDNETYQVTEPVGTEELLLACAPRAIDLAVAAKQGALPAGLVVARHSYQVSR